MTDTYSLDPRLAHWDTLEGRPYMGELFNHARWRADPNDLGCMCAQGQVLTQIAGWTIEMLQDVDQSEADIATAKAYNISVAHSVLLRQINDSVPRAPSIVLTDPGKVLGDQWSKLLDFWWFCDHMDDAAWDSTWDDTRDSTWDAAWDAAGDAARVAAGDAAWDNAWEASGDAACADTRDAVRAAVWEIQAIETLHDDGRKLWFLPTFGFASINDIPARPANYGIPEY